MKRRIRFYLFTKKSCY